MKIRRMILLIVLLISTDQIIKIVINAYFFDAHFAIIPSLLEFTPIFNPKHSYINALLYENFNVDLGLWIHVVSFLIIQAIILLLYDLLRSKLHNNTKILDFAIVFQLSAMICALIGNLIWEKGTLDYIYLKPLFVFDLKDLYNSCFMVLFPLTLLMYRKQFGSLKMNDWVLHPLNRLHKK